MRVLALPLALAVLAAGCVSLPSDDDPAVTAAGLTGAIRLPGGVEVHSGGRAAGLSYIHNPTEGDVKVTFPEGVLVVDADGRLVVPDGPVTFPAGAKIDYLPPYAATTLDVTIEAAGGTSQLTLALEAGQRLVDGDLAVELMKVQRDQFPHRMPGHESYGAAMDYFAAYFEALGYEVEVSEYPDAAKLPAGPQPGPASLSSVVAYKRGTLSPERYLVMGGHFDVVEQTVEGAFDNTAGTVATLAMAKAFQNVTTSHTMVFGLWGGEEDGILGSQAWLTAHPELVPFIDGYFNFDVTALAWPAPAVDPAPVVVAAGPDGLAAPALHEHAALIEKTFMQTGAPLVMEGVVQGQATGAGVNAQSDHTPFMLRGIPSYFTFTQRVDDVFTIIHKDSDTLENMTKYALKGVEGIGADLSPEEMAEGEAVLARSFETQMALAFYWFVLTDAGALPPASPAAGLPVPRPG